MSPDDVFRFITGEGLVEFVPVDFRESDRVMRFLKKRKIPFLATSEGTFKVEPEVFEEMVALEFKVKKL